jgi:hypothetical protein
MQYVTLDTNAWINLANGTEPARMLEALDKGVRERDITIILPTIIVDEWNRGKSKLVVNGVLKIFDDVDEGLGKILKVLSKSDNLTFYKKHSSINSRGLGEKKWDFFKNIASEFRKGRKEVEESIAKNISIVDELFSHYSTRHIEVKQSVALKAGKFALAKKAPFSSKNSFADALIVFSFIDYIEKNHITEAHFITYNTGDFCERKGGKTFLHPDLEPDFERTQSEFHQLAADGINKIYNNIAYENETFEFFELIKEIKEQTELEDIEVDGRETCEKCLHAINFFRVDLEDERVLIIPGQLEFEFAKKLPTNRPHEWLARISAGICSSCETEYFICPSCGVTNVVEDYDTRVECDDLGCRLPYRISSEFGDWHEETNQYTSQYTIITNNKTCQRCNKEFWNDGSDNNICEECKDEYYYGIIINESDDS